MEGGEVAQVAREGGGKENDLHVSTLWGGRSSVLLHDLKSWKTCPVDFSRFSQSRLQIKFCSWENLPSVLPGSQLHTKFLFIFKQGTTNIIYMCFLSQINLILQAHEYICCCCHMVVPITAAAVTSQSLSLLRLSCCGHHPHRTPLLLQLLLLVHCCCLEGGGIHMERGGGRVAAAWADPF